MPTITKQWTSGTGSATIQYGGSGNGQITVSSDDNNLYEERSMDIVVSTTAGSPTITRTISIVQAAKQRIDISAATVTAANQTYSGSAKTPTPTVTLNGTTIPSTGFDVIYSNNTNAGTATVTVTGKGDYTGTASGTFTIAKANPTYTAPAAQSLTYSGSSQYLTTSGSTSHGTIQYSSDGTNWYTTRRTATSAGNYTTYWRLVGDANHNDVSSTSINVTIAKKTLTITAKAQTITYGGSIATGTSQVTTSGLVGGDSLTAITLTASTSQVTTSGTITPSAATTTNGISNYSVTYNTGNLTINKANSSVTSAPTAKSLTYSRSAQSLVNAGSASGGTLYYKYTTTNSKPSSTSGFSSSIPTRTDAGTYYIWYYVKGDSNHNDTTISNTAVTVTIAKATPVVATAPSKRTGLSYTGSAQNLLSGGSVKHSSTDSTSVSGTFTYAQGTNAGTYSSLTWSFTPSDTTNYNSISGTVSGSVTIDKASRTISFTKAPTPIDVGGHGILAASVSAGSGDGTISFSSSNTSRASISGSTITGVATGTATITASVSAGNNYKSASTTYTVTVAVLDYADMGLPSGLLWRKYNIGASSITECGYYFSWGNTDSHQEGDGYTFNLDNYNATTGSQIQTELPLANDAARQILGNGYRMPSQAEVDELLNTQYTRIIDSAGNDITGQADISTSLNGVKGIYIESKSNSNRLFLPYGGYLYNTSVVFKGEELRIWTTTLFSATTHAMMLDGWSESISTKRFLRQYGLNIRAVK
jgi:hypothetical protein